MIFPSPFTALEKLARAGWWTSGYFFTALLATLLILTWIVTAPLLRCGVYLGDLYREIFCNKLKG